MLVASIGPITTATAQKRGMEVAVTAPESTTFGLVTALERYLAATTLPDLDHFGEGG